jgi:hypothetical protein
LAKKDRRFCLNCFSVEERNYGLLSEQSKIQMLRTMFFI